MKLQAIIDPMGKYDHMDETTFHNVIGWIPGWVFNAEFYDAPVKDALTEQYGFGELNSMNGKLDEDGVYTYPEDPDLYPLIKMTRGDETVFQYPYGIVAIRNADGDFITRMD
jgi:hypothetical protein